MVISTPSHNWVLILNNNCIYEKKWMQKVCFSINKLVFNDLLICYFVRAHACAQIQLYSYKEIDSAVTLAIMRSTVYIKSLQKINYNYI